MPTCTFCYKELPEGTKKVIDPYAQEILDEEIEHYICDDCYTDLKDAI